MAWSVFSLRVVDATEVRLVKRESDGLAKQASQPQILVVFRFSFIRRGFVLQAVS